MSSGIGSRLLLRSIHPCERVRRGREPRVREGVRHASAYWKISTNVQEDRGGPTHASAQIVLLSSLASFGAIPSVFVPLVVAVVSPCCSSTTALSCPSSSSSSSQSSRTILALDVNFVTLGVHFTNAARPPPYDNRQTNNGDKCAHTPSRGDGDGRKRSGALSRTGNKHPYRRILLPHVALARLGHRRDTSSRCGHRQISGARRGYERHSMKNPWSRSLSLKSSLGSAEYTARPRLPEVQSISKF